jgi:drug/metabolite transporter (DMT)-like permease
MSTSSPHTTDLTRGYAFALGSAALLSTTAIFIRHLTLAYELPALVLAFWRDVFVVLSLLPVLGLLRPKLLRLRRRDLMFALLYGLVLAIFNGMWILSVALNGAAVSTVLVYSSAAFTAILGWWFLKERLDWARLLAVGLSIAGCVMVSRALDPAAWTANLAGILTGILSGLCYAIYSLMGRSASQRDMNPWTTLLYTFGFAAVILLLFNLPPGQILPGTAAEPRDMLWLGSAIKGWAILLLLAAGPTLAGFGLYNVSLGYLPSSVANLILTSEPVFTGLVAYALLGERMDGVQIGGGLLIMGGVVFLRIHEGRLARASRPDAERDPEAMPPY